MTRRWWHRRRRPDDMLDPVHQHVLPAWYWRAEFDCDEHDAAETVGELLDRLTIAANSHMNHPAYKTYRDRGRQADGPN